jgi:hypothetical protein
VPESQTLFGTRFCTPDCHTLAESGPGCERGQIALKSTAEFEFVLNPFEPVISVHWTAIVQWAPNIRAKSLAAASFAIEAPDREACVASRSVSCSFGSERLCVTGFGTFLGLTRR